MAGARPSGFKQGGGFLNNVDGLIADYEFTTDLPGGGKAKKPKNEDDFVPLYFRLSARVDGADEDDQTSLFVGGAGDFEIEDDGKTLSGGEIRANSDLAIFINSLCEAGFPEANLPEDKINFEAIIGTRVRFVQERNEAKTAKLGKRKDKDGKPKYDRTDLKITKVYALPGKGGSAKTQPAKGKGAAAADTSVEELAVEVLKDVLSEAKNQKLAKAKLNVAALQKVLKNKAMKPLKSEILEWLEDDENLGGVDGVSYDSDKEIIELD